MGNCKCVLVVIFFVLFAIAQEPAKVDYTPLPKLVGDEIIGNVPCVPYLGSRQSPGDQIGTTAYDLQADFSYGQRLRVDGKAQAHIDWMYQDYPAQAVRQCYWNARFANGTYYGEMQASPSWSGYVQLDITREIDPDNQRSVITYHYNNGSGYYPWIDIDAGNIWGSWPNTPSHPPAADNIWPTICVANNNNILIATGDYHADAHHVYLTTDEGGTWIDVCTFDSCGTLSRHLRSSGNPGSNKAVFAHTRYITDVPNVQLDNDVCYTLSSDGGMTWGPYTNITNYQPQDSVRAYCDVNAVFDADDNLHVVWSGRRFVGGTFYEVSKIFHWDEVHDTITVVNSPSTYYNDPGGWWITTPTGGDPGAWRMPADMGQLVVDRNSGVLFCLWHGNDDYSDTSAVGYFNGEIYGAYSTDGGIIWSDYVNLTNTRSPGAGPGACYDEDYLTANPYIVNDSIWTTYVEDKDAGAHAQGEGSLTENPVRCWVFPKTMITGIEEHHSGEPSAIFLQVAPNPFRKELKIQYALSSRHYTEGVNSLRQKDIELRIYDASGRLVKSITQLPNYPITWSGCDQHGQPVPTGVYFVTLQDSEQSINTKVVKLE